MKIQNGVYYDLNSKLQSPFRQQDLLTASSFVDLCEENGIHTSERALNFFEREGLIFPAVRIDKGYIKFKKILADFEGKEEWRYVFADDVEKFHYKKVDSSTYYDVGGIQLKRPTSLDWHFEHEMITYPAEKGWQTIYDAPTIENHYATTPENLGNTYEPLYMPHQMFAVERLQTFLNPLLIQGLYFRTKDWQKVKEKVLENYSQEIRESNLNKIAQAYKLFAFYLFVLTEFEAKNREFYNELIEAKEDKDLTEEIVLDWSNDADTTVRDKLLSYMDTFKFNQEDIMNWRADMLVNGSFWGMQSKRRDIYLVKLSEEDLFQTEYAYWIVKILNWLLSRIGQKEITVIDLILKHRLCPYCGNSFNPTRKTQVACFSKGCQLEHNKKIRRERYKSGWYKKPHKKAKPVEYK